MHILNVPSFFFAKRTVAPNGENDSSMMPFLSCSSICFLISASSRGEYLGIGRNVGGVALGTRGITGVQPSLNGGNPCGSSNGNRCLFSRSNALRRSSTGDDPGTTAEIRWVMASSTCLTSSSVGS